MVGVPEDELLSESACRHCPVILLEPSRAYLNSVANQLETWVTTLSAAFCLEMKRDYRYSLPRPAATVTTDTLGRAPLL